MKKSPKRRPFAYLQVAVKNGCTIGEMAERIGKSQGAHKLLSEARVVPGLRHIVMFTTERYPSYPKFVLLMC